MGSRLYSCREVFSLPELALRNDSDSKYQMLVDMQRHVIAKLRDRMISDGVTFDLDDLDKNAIISLNIEAIYRHEEDEN